MLVRLSQIVLRVHLPNKNLNKEFVIFTVQNHITEITMALWMAFLNQVNEPCLVYNMDSQAPYTDSQAVSETTKSFATSLHKGSTLIRLPATDIIARQESQH
jgi:hypothetical protein